MSRKSLDKIADGIFRDAVTAIGSAQLESAYLGIIQSLLDVCSEATVEIENAYGPDNVVAKRLRKEIANVIGKQEVV